MYNVVITVLGLLFFLPVAAQKIEEVVEEAPSTDSVYTYWNSGYYNNIPKTKAWEGSTGQSYEDMLRRYQGQDFEYIESISNKLNFVDKLLERIGRFIDSLLPKTNMNIDERMWQVVGIVGGIIFLLVVYKLFFSGKKQYIVHEEEEDLDNEVAYVERNLMHVDIQTYIAEALATENYARAIRYQQLLNIQVLSQRGLLRWDYSKTNMELMEEVDNAELKREFLACAAIFDYVWFGNFPIKRTDYEHYAADFQKFQKKWS